MIVVPDPQNGSYTPCPAAELFKMGRRMHSTGFCVLCSVLGILLPIGNLPKRALCAISLPMPGSAHRIPTGLMLPVVVPPTHHQRRLRPHDLRALPCRDDAGTNSLPCRRSR